MTERERWIVYPLLFLALGTALRDKLFDQTTSKSILCQELTVVDSSRGPQQPVRVLARIGASPGAASNASLPAQMLVNGQLHVNTIVADNFVYRGRPFVPTVRIPNLSPADLMRALKRAENTGKAGKTDTKPPPRKQQEAP